MRPPDLMQSQWRCDLHGHVAPLHCPAHISADIVEALRDRVQLTNDEAVPVWCPWPLSRGWTVTGVAWAGDERTGPRATALCITGVIIWWKKRDFSQTLGQRAAASA